MIFPKKALRLITIEFFQVLVCDDLEQSLIRGG